MIILELHMRVEPTSLVDVWGTPVALIHSTVVLTSIVIVAGTNWKPLAIEPIILTLARDPFGDGVVVVTVSVAAVPVGGRVLALAVAGMVVVEAAVGDVDAPPALVHPETTGTNSSSPIVNKVACRVA